MKELVMAIRTSSAEWNGTLKEGSGTVRVGQGAKMPFSYLSRFEDGTGTNPEELIGAAHAGCFSMFLAALLGDAGHPARQIRTTAAVHLNAGPVISRIELATQVEAPGLTAEELIRHAEAAKKNCPVSKALAGPEITLIARLVPE
jgi:osmotically inducible protein OsmC